MKKIVLLAGVLAVFVLSFTIANAATKAEIQASIDDGLAWLAAKQVSGCGIGHWGEDYSLIGKTGLAVKKFEHDAILSGFESPFDPLYPYHDVVQWGLNYLFLTADTVRIWIQPHGDPDTDGDGYGVRWASDGRHFTYETGIALMAIVESGAPDRVVDVPGSYVNGWTYYQVAEDAMNWLAFIQNDDGGSGRGSWGYGDGTGADQSNSGYAVLGLSFAESPLPHGFELTVPQFVKDELGDAGLWVDYIQNDVSGGSGYTNPNANVSILETGNLLAEMAWYGDDVSTPRVQNALTYIANNWHNSGYGGSGWPSGWLNSYQAMFTMMKGLEAFVIEEIGGIDWYDEVTDTIVAQQYANGSWGPSFWDNWVGGDTVLTTCWALLTLQKVTPPIVVGLDIKPTSCPNPFNMTAQGKLPVAILGTEVFDVMSVDPATIELEGVPIFTKKNGSLQYSYDDVATPFPGELCDCWGMGPDGFMDLVMHFDRQAIAAALGAVADGDVLILTLTGATYEGRAIVGADCVVIRAKGGAKLTTSVPKSYALSQNHPNPFNPETEISYALPTDGVVTLEVYNLLGYKVATLVDAHQAAGTYAVQWNADNVPSGVYFYRMSVNGFTATKRMVLMK